MELKFLFMCAVFGYVLMLLVGNVLDKVGVYLSLKGMGVMFLVFTAVLYALCFICDFL